MVMERTKIMKYVWKCLSHVLRAPYRRKTVTISNIKHHNLIFLYFRKKLRMLMFVILYLPVCSFSNHWEWCHTCYPATGEFHNDSSRCEHPALQLLKSHCKCTSVSPAWGSLTQKSLHLLCSGCRLRFISLTAWMYLEQS